MVSKEKSPPAELSQLSLEHQLWFFWFYKGAQRGLYSQGILDRFTLRVQINRHLNEFFVGVLLHCALEVHLTFLVYLQNVGIRTDPLKHQALDIYEERSVESIRFEARNLYLDISPSLGIDHHSARCFLKPFCGFQGDLELFRDCFFSAAQSEGKDHERANNRYPSLHNRHTSFLRMYFLLLFFDIHLLFGQNHPVSREFLTLNRSAG
jgi:hypothetical protein